MLFLNTRTRQLRFTCIKFIYPFILIILFSCTQVENMGIFSKSRLQDVAGQDGFSTITFNDSFLIWTFGDTLLGTWEKPISLSTTFEESASAHSLIPNTLAITKIPDDNSITNLDFSYNKKNSKVVPFIQYKKNEAPQRKRLWALDGIRIKDTIYFFYTEIKTNEGNMKDPFIIIGSGIAQWHIPANWDTQHTVTVTDKNRMFSGSEPVFGDSILSHNDYIYILGHKKINSMSVSLFIARVKPYQITIKGQYEYLSLNGSWSSNIHDAGAFFNDIAGEGSLSFNKKINSYIIIYCSLKGMIKSAVFDDFSTLPAKTAKTIYQPPPLKELKNRQLYFYYSGKEIFSTSDAVYAIYIHPAIYQPILLKIPYSIIR